MARPGHPGVAPDVPVSPTPAPVARERPRLRAALGGGRRGGTGAPAPAATAARELWLAIHLPHYVLESLQARPGAVQDAVAPAAAAPVAVVDLERDAKVVCDCDAGAAAGGVVPGMALNSALALLPGLQTLSRDRGRERALLQSVATAALDFTPRVNLEPPDAVLLEVRGSLRLFGGARRLCDLLRQRLQSCGLEPRMALTPAPLASLWFARAGEEVLLRRPDALPARLATLSLRVTRWPERTLQALATMGVRNVGECLRLPRDGFARRFEPRMRLELDRALGRAHDPRAAFAATERFTARRDLEPELADTDLLQRALEPLVGELCAFLQGRGAGVAVLEFRLQHRDAPATRLRLRFVEPVASAARIATVLRERLSALQLSAPVCTVRLHSGPLVEARAEAGELFAHEHRHASAVPQLVERLRARLGAQAVQGLRLVPEHRPERAQESGDIRLLPRTPPSLRKGDAQAGGCPCFPRPVWLLTAPQPLAGGERPRYEGPLEIIAGPERIESGWWDGCDVRRDYYVACTVAGARLWIFRERRAQGGWFLHGVFG